ncbi:MAG: hypothetical protein AAFS10_21295 [Myxococcota bacterium]
MGCIAGTASKNIGLTVKRNAPRPKLLEKAAQTVGERTLADWRDAIINDYSNSSEMYVTELFDWYINL